MMAKRKIILYVDDDADDRELLAEAIRNADPSVELLFAYNGEEALQTLRERKVQNKPLPCLIVLDLNMPFVDGMQTYEALAEDSFLSQVPVMIFTSSEKPQDKMLFNDKGIPFFTKPFNVHNMGEIARQMIDSCD